MRYRIGQVALSTLLFGVTLFQINYGRLQTASNRVGISANASLVATSAAIAPNDVIALNVHADPKRIRINSQTNRLYVVDMANVLHIFAGNPLTEIGHVADLPTGMIDLNPQTERLYVQGKTDTLVIDGLTAQPIGNISEAGTLAVNAHNNRILIANASGVHIADGASNQLIGLIPYFFHQEANSRENEYAVGVVDNPFTDDLYIQVLGLFYAHGGVSQGVGLNPFDSFTYQKKAERILIAPGSLQDPITGHYYWSGHTGGDDDVNITTAYDKALQPIHKINFFAGALVLMPTERRLYLQDKSFLMVINVDTWENVGTYYVPDIGTLYSTLDGRLAFSNPMNATDQTQGVVLELIPPAALPLYIRPFTQQITAGAPPDKPLTDIVRSPVYEQDHTLFAGAMYGVYKSTDEGQHWQHILTMTDCACAVFFSPSYATDRTLFVTLGGYNPDNSQGIIRSMDGGATWLTIDAGLPDLDIYGLEISPQFSADQTLRAMVSFQQAVISTDRGDHWHPVLKPSQTPDVLTSH